jgi:hypothetical protein
MPTISITFSAAIATEVVDTLCDRFGYQTHVINAQGARVPNTETRNQFATRMISVWLKEQVKLRRQRIAVTAPEPDITTS